MEYTVGDLAKRCGLTVRALHHYEKLGLLTPSGRSEAGYRLYNDADVLRLHRLLAYRHSGLALKDIAPLLDAESPPVLEVLQRHIGEVQAQLRRQQRLLEALQRVAERAAHDEEGLTEHLLRTMGLMRSYEKYFDEADLQRMDGRRAELGEEVIKATESEWPALIQAVQQEMSRGTDPHSPRVKALAQRWQALVAQFTGEDQEVKNKFQTMWASEPGLQRDTGVTPELIGYLRAALQSDVSNQKKENNE
ncbi:MerR family transcriptional regulator [Paucibacter sp. AS339]|uniref:MerR family transcriptional regulator n=1 Tax=Paucibacter hankyongi TaxID=3133434 RepID=UPI00309B086E